MITILIADDHAIVRRGVREIIAGALDDVEFGEAENGFDALSQIQRQVWDLIILDLSMPGRSGIEVLSAVHKMQVKPRILVLSIHSEDQYAKRVLLAGARGYMNKESTSEELIRAVRKVLAGGRYVSAALAEKLAEDLNEQKGTPSHELLSDREFEILRLIASGKTMGQIADTLQLAPTTVSTYRVRILEKMGKGTTAELIRYALENHLVD